MSSLLDFMKAFIVSGFKFHKETQPMNVIFYQISKDLEFKGKPVHIKNILKKVKTIIWL